MVVQNVNIGRGRHGLPIDDEFEPTEFVVVGLAVSGWVQSRVFSIAGPAPLVGRKEMFYLTTHSAHFIYGYMASDIW